ncbi:DUF4145 domain-containing protein [Aquamicrobium sp.]|uniref:DUF4145 domain-containing protein n=1 Tax=Aquamicrobium sp. TaxID=1872579 RepID=UPI00258BD15B|nr:DUF4145 domain-containing protein [Aquamicrobium sp.]MCK9551239.1 DUF4145 domain-containing protein [Aquamicrobium sp.]
MTESKIGSKLKAFCANCKGDRNCEIKGHHRVSDSDGRIDWWCDWYLLVCCGCDHVFAQSVASDSESYYPVGYAPDGSPEYELDEQIRSWPARFKRPRPSWLDKLEHDIEHPKASDFSACLIQVYEALDHDLNILAAIGIRTSFDVASEILGVEPEKGFESKLAEMEKKSLITPSQRSDFEVLINAGNASAHRGWNPSFQDLDPLVDTLEHFINDTFVVPHLRKKAADGVAKVKTKVPVRNKKPKRKAGAESL